MTSDAKSYDYRYGVETARVTCLDRARLALEGTGQITCSHIMKRLQIQFDELSDLAGGDPYKPCEMLDFVLTHWKEGVEI